MYVENVQNTILAMDIKQEYENIGSINTAFDSINSNFTIIETTSESRVPLFEDVKVKVETFLTDGDEDSLENVTDQYVSQLPSNTILKEEIDIEYEPHNDENLEVNCYFIEHFHSSIQSCCSMTNLLDF